MTAILLAAVILVGFPRDGFSCGFRGYETANQNLKYINFKGFDSKLTYQLNGKKHFSLPNKAWRDREIVLWKKAIRKAALMLPEDFFKKIKKSDWIFIIDRTTLFTALNSCGLVEINLFPDHKEFQRRFTWEPFQKDGLVESERIFVALHEIAHEYSCWHETGIYNIDVVKEQATTKYGREKGADEDFSDTFALYVMWSDYLKYFPNHYQEIKKILAREYKSEYPMPGSIRTRLIANRQGGLK